MLDCGSLSLDTVAWQARWTEIEGFYTVPETLADAPRIEPSKAVFRFFENDLNI